MQLAGGEPVHDASEATGGAADIVPERDDAGDVARVLEESARDQGRQRAENGGEAAGDVGDGSERGRVWRGKHVRIYNV